ncbi:MAG: DUF4870 domain-containing protein [Pyrinomonadaceae bacterium]
MQNPPPDQQGYGYGNQYGVPPPPPPLSNQPGGEEKAKTQLGLDANLGAALGYPIGILAIILFVMEKDNRFARFHALQSLLYHVAAVVVFIVIIVVGLILSFILGMVSSALGGIAGVLMFLLYMLLILAYIGGLILAAVKAYQGQWFKLPLVGSMTEKIINK